MLTSEHSRADDEARPMCKMVTAGQLGFEIWFEECCHAAVGQTSAGYHHRRRFRSVPSRGCVFMYFNLCLLLLFNDVMIVILPTRIQHTHTDLYCKFRLLRPPFRYCCNCWCYCSDSRIFDIHHTVLSVVVASPLKSRHTRPPLERESSSFAFFALLSSSHTHSLTDWLTNRRQEFHQRVSSSRKENVFFQKRNTVSQFLFLSPTRLGFVFCLFN